jgi:hypothetical protein
MREKMSRGAGWIRAVTLAAVSILLSIPLLTPPN